jgi:hypothetical protein
MNLDEYHRERSEAVWRRNRRELEPEGDHWTDLLKSRFKEMWRLAWLRWVRTRAFWTWALLGVVVGSSLAIVAASPWPVGITVRHLLAACNCDMARAMDLAPACRGAPGYWARNDADDDGIACEPWPK